MFEQLVNVLPNGCLQIYANMYVQTYVLAPGIHVLSDHIDRGQIFACMYVQL